MAISVQEQDRYDELQALSGECVSAAQRAIDQGAAVLTREWFDAASAALRTAALIVPPKAS
jgi:hypothetical protein